MSNPNVELARRWFEEVWNQRRAATIDELLTDESVGHMETGDVRGVEAFKRVHAQFVSAFPDLRIETEAVLAAADEVVVRWRMTARHAGDGFGFKATHEPVVCRGITWLRFEGGKLMEGWDSWNMTGLVEQVRAADLRAAGRVN